MASLRAPARRADAAGAAIEGPAPLHGVPIGRRYTRHSSYFAIDEKNWIGRELLSSDIRRRLPDDSFGAFTVRDRREIAANDRNRAQTLPAGLRL